ncbi:hypothetical protein ACTXPD_12900 [Vreelandella alkaliphila]|uniref:hypothetical protein n=1 Tax=Halomonadaceae TaxID=28256 RepID=UPI001D02FA21|nr:MULTISPECIES: hypothetical protein [unclassified Halomonas]
MSVLHLVIPSTTTGSAMCAALAYYGASNWSPMVNRASGQRNLTLIKNDANEPSIGIGKLIEAGRVKRLITSRLGLNRAAIDALSGKSAIQSSAKVTYPTPRRKNR